MKFSPRFATSLLIFLLSIQSSLAIDLQQRRKKDPKLDKQCLTQVIEATLAAKNKPRDSYNDENLRTEFTTVEQNEDMNQLADNTPAGTKTLFFRYENALMKKLNDMFQEKNFVTSATNRFKSIIAEKLKAIQAEDPGLQVHLYDDFKSGQYAVQWTGKAPANLEEQLNWSFQTSMKEFTDELIAKNLVRKGDLDEQWFRAAHADTADRASITARIARELEGPNRVVGYDEPWVQSRLKEKLTEIEDERKLLQNTLSPEIPMIEVDGKKVVSDAVFDLVRKSSGNKYILQRTLNIDYPGAQVTQKQAEVLLAYAKDVDVFSPALRIAVRNVINLDEARFGGLSGDFLGLGSANFGATARALAQAKNIDHALVLARQGEVEVTKKFREKLAAFQEIVGDGARCSGDDCVAMPSHRAYTQAEKEDLVARLAANPLTRSMRISFVPDGIEVKGDRTKIATQGEDIEKAMRKRLAGDIPKDRLNEILIAIDMQVPRIFKGTVDMIVKAVPGKPLTPEELALMRHALKESVFEVNRKISNRINRSRYHPYWQDDQKFQRRADKAKEKAKKKAEPLDSPTP